MTISNARRMLVCNWLATPNDDRKPLTVREFRKSIHMSDKTFRIIQIDWMAEQKQKADDWKVMKKAQDYIFKASHGEIPEVHTEDERWLNMEDQIYTKGLEGNVKAMELYARIRGKYIEKSESKVKISLDADEYRRIEREATRELSGNSQGKSQMPPERALLLEESRENPEQGNNENGELGSVAVPDSSS